MRAIDLSFDLEGLADLLDLTPFALDVWLAWLTMSLGFGIALWAIWEMRHWRSPAGRLLRRPGPDPFAQPFGDIPTVNRGPGAAGAVAKRSPAEEGHGFSAVELHPFRSGFGRDKSAEPVSPAVREGSGGVGNVASRGAAAASSPREAAP